MWKTPRQGRPFIRRGGIWWIATLLFLLLAVLALTGKNGAMHTLRLKAIRADLQNQVHDLGDENGSLRTELGSLRRDDPEAIERRAREDLGMVRPGEIRIDFRDSSAPSER
jgi:cell division protein FtsB